MAQFCAACGTQMADGVAVCPGCGKGTAPAAPAAATSTAPAGGGLQDNVAGMLAYFTIPAIIFLLMEPYNKNKFIRFHSFQSLFLSGGLIAAHIVLGFIPILGWIVSVLLFFASIVLWIILLMKAYQGQKFKLFFIGDLAEQQV